MCVCLSVCLSARAFACMLLDHNPLYCFVQSPQTLHAFCRIINTSSYPFSATSAWVLHGGYAVVALQFPDDMLKCARRFPPLPPSPPPFMF